MKRFFIIIILLLLVVALALFVFVLTFDANQYKPLLTERIERAIHKDVRISNISLSVIPRTVIVAHGLSLKDVDRTWDDVILKVDSVEASVKLLPLIKKEVEIERLVVKGLDIDITKDLIEDMTSVDMYSMPHLDIRLSVVEATLKNISLYGPIEIDARLSVFARGIENIKLKALLYPDLVAKKPYIKDLDVKVALGRVSLRSAFKALGMRDVSRRVMGSEIAGELTLRSQKIVFDPEGIYRSGIYVDLSNGATDLIPVKDGIKDMELKAEIADGDMVIQRFTGRFGKGRFSADGTVKDLSAVRTMDMDITLRDVDIAELFPGAAHGEPYLEGTLNAEIRSSADSLNIRDLKGSLVADGTIDIDNPVLRNMNVLAVVFDKLDMLPGLVRKLKRKLPDYYRELLKQDYTRFKPLEIDFNIEKGKIFFVKDVGVESDAFYLVANGYLDLYSAELAKGFSNLFIPKDLSQAFIDVVDELKYLRTHHGMITIPLDIGGRLPDLSITPDMGYVIQKLTVSKGQELLGEIFRKKRTNETEGVTDEGMGSEGQAREGKQEEQEEVEPAEALIRTIFDIITTPQDTQ